MKPPQKDQGWAWVVLAASTLSLYMFVLLTLFTAFSMVEMMEDLEVGSGPISTIGSITLGCSTLLGPLSGTLINLLSIRTTVQIGVLLCSGGLFLASFARSLTALTLFYAILTGLGYGIAYTASVVVISFHFERHRMLANGVIMCSSGFGILSHAYLVTWAIDSHGWRWTCVLVSAIFMQVVVLATLYFPTDTERMTMLDWSSFTHWMKGRKEISDNVEGDMKGERKDKGDEDPEQVEADCEVEKCNNSFSEVEQSCAGNRADHGNHCEKYPVKIYEKDGTKDKINENVSSMEREFKSGKKPEPKDVFRKESHTHADIVDWLKYASHEKDKPLDMYQRVEMSKRFVEFLAKKEHPPKHYRDSPSDAQVSSEKVEDCFCPVSLPADLDITSSQTCQFVVNHPRKLCSNDGQFVASSAPTRAESEMFINDSQEARADDALLNNSVGNINNGLCSSLETCKTLPVVQVDISNGLKRRCIQRIAHSELCVGPGRKGVHQSMVSLQADVISSSLLLPIKVEDITVEEVGVDKPEASLKQNMKRVVRCKIQWVLCLNGFTFIFGYAMNSIHFPAFAAHQGVPREGISTFYTVFGLVMMLARLGGGSMLNCFRSQPPLVPLSCVLQLLLGMFVGLAPFYATSMAGLYVMQMGLAVTYGLGFMLYSPICAQILGIELLPISFGLVQMFNGLGYILSPSISGTVVTVGVLPLCVITFCTNMMRPGADRHDNSIQEEP